MKIDDVLIKYLTFLAIISISIGMFWAFRQNFFAYDDFAMIEHVMEGPEAVLKGYNNILRLVTSCFLWPLFALSGHSPLGYNLFSLTLYVLNACLLYVFCKQLFCNVRMASLTAIFFVASSVGCDAVFWKAAFSTLLNVTFYLCTLIVYIKYRESNNTKYFWYSVSLFAFAVFSKEESASLPFIIILIEVLFLKEKNVFQILRRIVPFCLLIIFYLLLNYTLIYLVFHGQSELVKHSKLRPLHTLLAPWSAFFIAPDGRLSYSDARIYLTACLLPVALFFSGKRSYFLFALAWVFFTFLPQSLSTLSQFEPKYIFNSISRHLYLPSIGVALAYALMVCRLESLLPKKVYPWMVVVILVIYTIFNFQRVQFRGNTWALDSVPIKTFLSKIQEIMPVFPANSYIYVTDAPTGRAYVQQAMRAFYMNPSINWIRDPNNFIPQPGMSVYLISCQWNSPEFVNIEVKKYYDAAGRQQ